MECVEGDGFGFALWEERDWGGDDVGEEEGETDDVGEEGVEEVSLG